MKTQFVAILALFFSINALSEIKFIPVDDTFRIDYSYVNDSCNCFLTGNFDYDNEPDSLFAIMSKTDSTLKGIEICYSDGSSADIAAGLPTTVYEIFDKKERDYRQIDNLPFDNWMVFEKENINDNLAKSIPTPKSIAASVIKKNKIKSDSDFLFLDFGDVYYILCRSESEWYFINCGV